MAQITFLATDEDYDGIWQMILVELGMTAYPDPWFGELPAPALTTRADVAANLADYPRVAPGLGYFLTSPDWSLEPLEYDLCNTNPNFAPHWNVIPRYGGPSIHFIPTYGYPWRKEPHQIITGSFGDYPYYYSAVDNRQIVERPFGLASTMKAIRQWLGSHGKTVRAATGERAIATGNALAAHKAGVILRQGDIHYFPVQRGRRTKRGLD